MTGQPRHFQETSLDLAWDQLTSLTRDLVIQSLKDQGLGQQYTSMLNALKVDMRVGDKVFLGMRRAPASKNRHHDIEGGLVIHLLEMWRLWENLREVIHAREWPILSDSNVWRCILHHDLNKVHRYMLVTEDPWEVDYAENYKVSALLGSAHMSVWILGQHGIGLPVELHNALIVSEGGFSKDERPKAETVLAKVAYLLDELSANVVDRLGSGRLFDSKYGGLDGARP